MENPERSPGVAGLEGQGSDKISEPTRIETNPGHPDHQKYIDAEAWGASEAQDIVEKALAAEALTPVNATQASIEMMERLAEDPDNFQKNVIESAELIGKMQASSFNHEALSSVLMAELQVDGRNLDVNSMSGYVDAIGAVDALYRQLNQQGVVDDGEFEKIQTTINTRLNEAQQAVADRYTKGASSRQPAQPVASQPSSQLKSAAELAQEGTLRQRIEAEQGAASEENNSVQTAVSPESVNTSDTTTTNPAHAPEANREAEAELQGQVNEAVIDVQRTWNNAPVAVRNGHSIDLRPLINLKGDVRAYAKELLEDMREGKYQYGYLKEGGGQDDAARNEKVVEELGRMKELIEREAKSNPRTAEEYAEVDKLLETNLENFDNKFRNLSKSTQELVKNDPHVQKRLRQMKKKPGLLERLFRRQ